MDKGSQKYVHFNNSSLSGKDVSGRLQKSRSTYVQQRQGRKRISPLTIFGKLISGQLVNSSFYTMAEGIVKRIKTCLMIGWNRSNLKRQSSQGRGCDGTKQRKYFSTLDCNVNARSSDTASALKERGTKRHYGKPRRVVARSIGRPRLKQRQQAKSHKIRRPDRSSQLSKKFNFLRKRCARLKKDNDKVVASNGDVGSLQLTETDDISTLQQNQCQMATPNEVQCPREKEISVSKCVQAKEQMEMVPCQENMNENVKAKRKRKNRRTRQKTEALLNMLEADKNKDISAEGRVNEQRFPVKKSKRIRKKCGRNNSVIMSQPHTGSSSFNFKMNASDVNDWPSLAELERPKGLIKEAAKEIVRSKQVGSVARNARKLLVDKAASKTNELDTSQQTTTFCSNVNQQHGTQNIATNQRTWASVAAQSLTGLAKITFGYITAAALFQTKNAESIDNTPRHKSPTSETLHKLNKRKVGSKLDCSTRQWADYYKGKEKPNSRKYLAENEERTKIRKTVRCRRNKIKQRCAQKEQTSALYASHKNKKVKKVEKADGQADKTKSRQSLVRLKSSLHQNWQVDKMPVVYTQPAGPVINLADQPESEATSEDIAGSALVPSLNRENSAAGTPSISSENVPSDSNICTQLGALSMNSNESVGLIGDSFTDTKNASFGTSRHDILVNTGQCPSPMEEETSTQKKVSARYRALLRGNTGRLEAEVTEKQTRRKKTDSLWQDKNVIRKKQRLLRQERQRTQVSSHQSPAGTCTETPAESNIQTPAVHGTCPYWLRSRPSRSASVQCEAPSMTPKNNMEGDETRSVETFNTVSTPITNTTLCRHSEPGDIVRLLKDRTRTIQVKKKHAYVLNTLREVGTSWQPGRLEEYMYNNNLPITITPYRYSWEVVLSLEVRPYKRTFQLISEPNVLLRTLGRHGEYFTKQSQKQKSEIQFKRLGCQNNASDMNEPFRFLNVKAEINLT